MGCGWVQCCEMQFMVSSESDMVVFSVGRCSVVVSSESVEVMFNFLKGVWFPVNQHCSAVKCNGFLWIA